jgi:hypothetical protein
MARRKDEISFKQNKPTSQLLIVMAAALLVFSAFAGQAAAVFPFSSGRHSADELRLRLAARIDQQFRRNGLGEHRTNMPRLLGFGPTLLSRVDVESTTHEPVALVQMWSYVDGRWTVVGQRRDATTVVASK